MEKMADMDDDQKPMNLDDFVRIIELLDTPTAKADITFSAFIDKGLEVPEEYLEQAISYYRKQKESRWEARDGYWKAVRLLREKGRTEEAIKVISENGDDEAAANLAEKSGLIELAIDYYARTCRYNHAVILAERKGLFDKCFKILRGRGEYYQAIKIAERHDLKEETLDLKTNALECHIIEAASTEKKLLLEFHRGINPWHIVGPNIKSSIDSICERAEKITQSEEELPEKLLLSYARDLSFRRAKDYAERQELLPRLVEVCLANANYLAPATLEKAVELADKLGLEEQKKKLKLELITVYEQVRERGYPDGKALCKAARLAEEAGQFERAYKNYGKGIGWHLFHADSYDLRRVLYLGEKAKKLTDKKDLQRDIIDAYKREGKTLEAIKFAEEQNLFVEAMQIYEEHSNPYDLRRLLDLGKKVRELTEREEKDLQRRIITAYKEQGETEEAIKFAEEQNLLVEAMQLCEGQQNYKDAGRLAEKLGLDDKVKVYQKLADLNKK